MPISVTTAWEEASASLPDDPMLITVELIHPVFVAGGVPAPIRAVRNTVDMAFKLEVGAPLNSGQIVTFGALPFEIDYPQITDLGAEARLRIDNVNRQFGPILEAATTLNEPVRVIFRGYLASDPNTVGQGPYTLFLRSVRRSGGAVEGSLQIATPRNLRVLREVYDMVRFKSLLQAS